MGDYMPHRDGDLAQWEENFNTKLPGHATAVGVLPAEVTEVDTVITAHNTSFVEMVAVKETAKSKVAANNARKKSMRLIWWMTSASSAMSRSPRRPAMCAH